MPHLILQVWSSTINTSLQSGPASTHKPLMLRFFDGWQIKVKGHDIVIPSRKRVALLAYLAIEGNQRHSRAALLGLLWPEMSETQARNNLRVVLAGLRKTLTAEDHHLTAVLQSNRHEVWLQHQGQIWLDVAEFQQQITQTDTHLHESRTTCSHCQHLLATAVDLYSGELLQGFHLDNCPAFDEWLLIQREMFHLEATQVLTELSIFYEHEGDYATAEKYTRHLLQLDPLQEDSQRKLMRLLAYQGQRSAALSQYEQCCQVLQQDLDVGPNADTVWLYQQIKANTLAKPEAQQATESVPPKGKIPASTTPFIGREQELIELSERLAKPAYRLITLVGPGGIGKTRLAVETARQNRHLFADGVWFISLAELEKQTEIPTAILATLNVPFSGETESPVAQLLAYLKPRQLLLVIDNLEHLMSGIDLFTTILIEAPKTTLLVTSREELPLQAADLFVLTGLAWPQTVNDPHAKQYEAVRLFADRAKRINKQFSLHDAVMLDVVQICQLVEGLPLALELAATITRDYTCRDIAETVAHDLEILTTTAQDMRPQHRSMQAVFDYSWQLLSKEEQQALAQLAIFRGGFDMVAARQVTTVSRLLISQLRYKSLIRSQGSGRFDLHFLIRQLALSKLDELAATNPTLQPAVIQEQHCHYFLTAVSNAADALQGWTPNQTLSILKKDLDNIRQAWQFAIRKQEWSLLKDVARPLSWFYSLSNFYSEGEAVFKGVLAQVDTAITSQPQTAQQLQSLHSQLLYGLIISLLDQNKTSEARPLLHRLLNLADQINDTYTLIFTQLQLGITYINQGDNETAQRHLEAGLNIAANHTYPKLKGLLLRAFANIWRQRGAYTQFEQYLLQALEIQKRAKHAAEVQTILTWLGVYRRNQGDIWGGRVWLEEAMTLNSQVGDKYREATILAGLGIADLEVGHYQASRSSLKTALTIYQNLNDLWHIVWSQTYLALAHYHEGQLAPAIHHAQQAIKLGLSENVREIVARAQVVLAYTLTAKGQLEPAIDQFQHAETHWGEMGNHQLRLEALAGLAEIAFKQNKFTQARQYITPVITFIESNSLSGVIDQHRVYWTCHHILHKLEDSRAYRILQQAHDQIQAQARLIDDPQLAHSYRHNITAHVQITKAWKPYQ